MKVEVDTSRCQGHTLCAMIAPGVFELDDTDGHAQVAIEVVPAEYHEQVHEAVRSCPEQAIHILTAKTER
ncbi:ferredoxin [Mycolicibacterium conceptionense]|uniref:Ferredoxin n=1 Tax=Mycolicibacterium conceptionense TaxID=451644 RepID=A0A1A0PNC1_9MYCO|nr:MULTISPECIES: ferredoxin [Mycolicibacterium]MCW1822603.1 ferredoxin [Mycolicibacterium senegalense]OBB11540.1 ferredoxin [Mycolicibacterium conceptionense]OBF08651.1 ferredoxin [Mycolicibacterium conceptionense]OBF12894.1 ferredoxin [Mycolicibacterium conceptionense]OBF45410.1 ferredoxin [Mycolicibacterium conceptionense]